jgi:Ricin-type beta-trefoil lectin domain-like
MKVRRTASVLAGMLAVGASVLMGAQPAQADTPQPTPGVFYEVFDAFSAPPACVDVPGGSTRPGARLQAFRCHSGSNQLWQFLPRGTNPATGNLIYEVANQNSQQCFELPQDPAFAGEQLEQAGCFDFDTEHWEARFVFFKTIPVYQFANAKFPGLCLALGNGGTQSNGTPIVLAGCNAGDPAQLWSLG